MRFYQLTIADSDGTVYQVDKGGLGFARSTASMGPTFSSTYTNWQTSNSQQVGQPNPNALNIGFDLPVYLGHEPQGGALIRVWGLGIHTISQASDLNPVGDVFKKFTLRAGMSKGLPLANPAQQGVIAQGLIWQAFGNWEGTEQTLDIIVNPGPPPSNYGIPIILNWEKGQPLTQALQQILPIAFPGYSYSVDISPNLVAPSDHKAVHLNVDAFFKWLHTYTKWLGSKIYGKNYSGVQFSFAGEVVRVRDNTAKAKTTQLAFQDLVGQPTWIGVNTIIFPTVMRGDIGVFDYVKFPEGVLLPYALTAPSAAYPNSPAASNSTFKGTFQITEMHHYANFRQPDAASWNTTCKAIVPAKAS